MNDEILPELLDKIEARVHTIQDRMFYAAESASQPNGLGGALKDELEFLLDLTKIIIKMS